MKNYPKKCIDCGEADYEMLTTDFVDVDSFGNKVTVADIEVLRCPNCKEELIPAESCKKISKIVAESNCPECKGTGWVGDQSAGYNGEYPNLNSEVARCECQSKKK